MRLKFLFTTCLLAALFVDLFAADSNNRGDVLKSKLGDSRKDTKHRLMSLMSGTPVDKADGWNKLESDGQHEKGPSGQHGDTIGQPVVANPYEAGAGGNAYGTRNIYGAGAAYGYNPHLYGNPYSFSNGGPFAPNNYPYTYGMNPCNCPQGYNQYGGGSYNPNSIQGPKPLHRNQDAVGRQYQGIPQYAQYPPRQAVQYPLLPYPAVPVGYAYQPYNRYPYNPYYTQQRQLVMRNSRHDKHQPRAKQQRGEKYRDKIRHKERKTEHAKKHH